MLNKKGQEGERGFTLIEIMTSLAILAIAIVILLSLRNRDIALSEQSYHIIEATLLARQKISDISLTGEEDTGEQKGDFGPIYPKYKWEMEILETSYPQVKELIVKVFWKDQSPADTVQFTTYLFVET